MKNVAYPLNFFIMKWVAIGTTPCKKKKKSNNLKLAELQFPSWLSEVTEIQDPLKASKLRLYSGIGI